MIIGIFTHFFAVVTTLAERQFFRALAKLIGRRAARLSACGIAAIVGKMGYLDEGCSVGADGSLYNVRNPTFFWLSMNLTTLMYVNLNLYVTIWKYGLWTCWFSVTRLLLWILRLHHVILSSPFWHANLLPWCDCVVSVNVRNILVLRIEFTKDSWTYLEIRGGAHPISRPWASVHSFHIPILYDPVVQSGMRKLDVRCLVLLSFSFCCLESWLDLSYWRTYFQYCRNIVTHHAEDGSGVGSAIIAGERLLLLYAFLSP